MKRCMYRLLLVPGLLWLAVLHSCSSNHSPEKKVPEPVIQAQQPLPAADFLKSAGKITDRIACSIRPELSYCLYLPSNYSSGNFFPVIFIFDAHGDGKLPVAKYLPLAEEFKFVLVGSNSSRNGLAYDELVSIAHTTIQDVSDKITIDPKRIYTMGFSGGARVAGAVAVSENNIAGIIGCGAAYMDERLKSKPGLLCFGFAGLDDFNLLEMTDMHAFYEAHGVKNYFQVFKGKHEWPDTLTMRNALEMLTVPAPEKKQALEKKIAAAGVTPQMAKEFTEEREAQKKYMYAFNAPDIFWWKNEISNLQQCAGAKQHRCKRLLAYIGVAVYSYSTNAVKNHNDAIAESLLQVYRMADPQNNEERFLEAILRARQGNNLQAFALLNEALNLGFNDFSRIDNEPDFDKLKSMNEYRQLMSHIKNVKS